MEHATVAAGQLQEISKEGSRHGRSHKKPLTDAGGNYKDKPPSPNHHLIKHIQVGGGRGRSAGTIELDSHANMVVIGAQGTIIQ